MVRNPATIRSTIAAPQPDPDTPPFSDLSRDKVVVRRLPHAMKEEELFAVLTAAATEAGMGDRGGSWDLVYFAPGKMSKKRGRVRKTIVNTTSS